MLRVGNRHPQTPIQVRKTQAVRICGPGLPGPSVPFMLHHFGGCSELLPPALGLPFQESFCSCGSMKNRAGRVACHCRLASVFLPACLAPLHCCFLSIVLDLDPLLTSVHAFQACAFLSVFWHLVPPRWGGFMASGPGVLAPCPLPGCSQGTRVLLVLGFTSIILAPQLASPPF